MNKAVQFILIIIGMLVGCTCVSVGVHKYLEKDQPTPSIQPVQISADSIINAVFDPQMEDVESVLLLQQGIILDQQYDSVFCSIPEDQLVNIAKVVIGKYRAANITNIVDEYTTNGGIYRFISGPPEAIVIEHNDSVPIEPTDTIINGRGYRRL